MISREKNKPLSKVNSPVTCSFLLLNPLPVGQSVPCLLQTLVIRFWDPRRFGGAWRTGQEGRLALPVGAKRGWRERGDVPAQGELSRLAVHTHFSLKGPLANLQIHLTVVRIIGGAPRTRYPISPTGGSKANDYDLELPQILMSRRVSPYLQNR